MVEAVTDCLHPTAGYVARDYLHIDKLVHGQFAGACQNEEHHHRILRIWAMAEDLALHDA